MKLTFTKMHGAGNDFIVIDATQQTVQLSPELCRRLADRRFGIGADQILMVEKSDDLSVDFRYRIFNADGSEVEQCGNGARAFVKFVIDKGLTSRHQIRVQTLSGVISPRLEPDGRITVDMGAPIFALDRLPFDGSELESRPLGQTALWPLDVAGLRLELMLVSMGNPHAVYLLDDAAGAPVAQLGPLIENHPRFAKRVNAGFMQVLDRQHIQLRVFERGAGETLACGTGACAAVVSGIQAGLLDSTVSVATQGGALSISWLGGTSSVFLTGPAVTVFEGYIDI